MQKRQLKFVLLFILGLLAPLSSGCDQQTKPEKYYQKYYEACAQGKFDEAASYLAENARETSSTLGSCAYTHDAINTIEAQKGNPPLTFTQDPLVKIQETTAYMTWFDDQGNTALVSLILVDGEWKITDAIWSY